MADPRVPDFRTFGDLRTLVRDARFLRQLSLREAAKQMHVSASTLSRIEGGGGVHVPDLASLIRIARWLGLSVVLMPGSPMANDPTRSPSADAGTPDIRAIHTEHESWTGLRFQFKSGSDVEAAADIATLDSLLETMRSAPRGFRLLVSEGERRVLLIALGLYWAELGERFAGSTAEREP